jgi:hypothetical protein
VNNSTAGRKLVRFSFPAAFAGPRAQEQSVHLIGSFTGWQVRTCTADCTAEQQHQQPQHQQQQQ